MDVYEYSLNDKAKDTSGDVKKQAEPPLWNWPG